MATLRIVAPWRAISCVPENLLKSTNLPLSAVRGGTIVQPWMRAAPLAPSQRGKRLGDRGGWERRWSSPATIFPTNPPLSDPHGRKVCRRPQVPGPRPRRLSFLTVLPSYRLTVLPSPILHPRLDRHVDDGWQIAFGGKLDLPDQCVR